MPQEDLRLHRGFFENIKIRRLKKALAAEPDCPTCALMKIWFYAAFHCTDGIFPEGFEETDLALIADWSGDEEKFVRTLGDLRLVYREGGRVIIHDWEDWQRWVSKAKQRSEAARKAARVRHGISDSNAAVVRTHSGLEESHSGKIKAHSAEKKSLSPNTNSNSKTNSKTKTSSSPSAKFPLSVFEYYNERVCPPFVRMDRFPTGLNHQIRNSTEVLREIVGHDTLEASYTDAWCDFLEKAASQYRHGNVPCKWNLWNITKEENMSKIADGMFEPVDESKSWAEEAKRRLQG